ncbi:MAG: ATP-grasp domain-containing protein [Candidatus Omnitrophica bacterium]|nr:ATP-grasp domain-containing protein [Candidatus Omnitrophota bacterium]
MKVGLTFNEKRPLLGGRNGRGVSLPEDTYLEWDDAETITAIAAALRKRHDVVLIEADERSVQAFRREEPDIVFNIAEGRFGPLREAEIPALLDSLGIPYTGSGPETLSVALDKAWTKRVLRQFGIATPDFLVCEETDYYLNGLTFPLIVKPLWEGSSKGILDKAVVETPQELRKQVKFVLERYQEPALIEKFLPGREFTLALLGNDSSLEVLPVVEINLNTLPRGAHPIYSYEAKWVWDTPKSPLRIFECPAKIPYTLERKLSHLAKRTFQVLKCRDWCRIDMRLDEKGEPHVLEVNPLPGILPNPEQNSCFPKAARAQGMKYEELILEVLSIACKRVGLSDEVSRTRHYSLR